MPRRELAMEEPDELCELIWKIVRKRRLEPLPPQRESLERRAARGSADAEIDPLRIERMQHAELLGDFERTVMRQHHSAGAHADALGLCTDTRDEDLRRRTRERLGRMVLRDPVALVSEPIGEPRELDGVCK